MRILEKQKYILGEKKKSTKIQYDSKHADTYNVFYPTTMTERRIE